MDIILQVTLSHLFWPSQLKMYSLWLIEVNKWFKIEQYYEFSKIRKKSFVMVSYKWSLQYHWVQSKTNCILLVCFIFFNQVYHELM